MLNVEGVGEKDAKNTWVVTRTFPTTTGTERARFARVVACAGAASLVLHAGLASVVFSLKIGTPGSGDAAQAGWTSHLLLNPQEWAAATEPGAREATRSAAEDDVDLVPPQARAMISEAGPEVVPEARDVEVRPGIDDGAADSPAWLGAAEATPHSGVLSQIDQAAFSMSPGLPGAPGAVVTVPDDATTAEAGEGGTNAAEAGAEAAVPARLPERGASTSGVSASVSAVRGQSSLASVVPARGEQTQAPVRDDASARGAGRATQAGAQRNPEALIEPRALAEPDASLRTLTQGLERQVAEAAGRATETLPDSFARGVPEEEAEAGAVDDASQSSGKNGDLQARVEVRADENVAPEAPQLAESSTPTVAPAAIETDAASAAEATVSAASPAAPTGPASKEGSSAGGVAGAPGTRTSAAAGQGGQSKLPGEASDAESVGTSQVITVDYRPGRPLAGKGIRVRPVAPRLSHTTRLTTLPKNPVVIIKFNRQGIVKDVQFENGEGTGYPDVDGPLRDSIFRWTATGKALSELPTHDPEARVTMKIQYLLRE